MDILNSNTKRSREIETLSLELRKHPTDLFHSFLPTSPNTTLRRHIRHQSPEPEKEELNLGLSLGGRFGVDKSHKGLLVRSSSLADARPLIRAEEEAAAALVRTASLPQETEEEWRKRKELQSLRRMEAKRKRSDKHRCIIRENGSTENLNLNPGQPGKPNPGTGYPKSGFCGDLQGLFIQQQKQDGSQRSGESQGGSKSSSNASEPERINTIQGNMPCVFTIGDGPRGRRVEGILYRYKKGEEVRIMCVCHGSFFTPAEFLNHAGAHNVAHPLKRIVVNSNASPFS